MPRIRLAFTLGAALALACVEAAAGTGGIKVYLRDDKGVLVDGKATAKKGSTVKNCNTEAGRCTMTGLAAGTWTVTAKTSAGTSAGPKTVTVKSGKTQYVTLHLAGGGSSGSGVTKGSSGSSRGGGVTILSMPTVVAKDLGKGSKKKAYGTVRDDKGVLLDGKVTVYEGSELKGESKTEAGKYSVYDLAAGTYKFRFTAGSKSKTKSVTIKASQAVVVNFSID